jgi:hypothetical protein
MDAEKAQPPPPWLSAELFLKTVESITREA